MNGLNSQTKISQLDALEALLGTLDIMQFCTLHNLCDVVVGLQHGDCQGLALVEERNAKQSRLRAEVEFQVSQCQVLALSTKDTNKVKMAPKAAFLFERTGSRTVEISRKTLELIQQKATGPLHELSDLFEGVIFTLNYAIKGFIEDDVVAIEMARKQRNRVNKLGLRLHWFLHSRTPFRSPINGDIETSRLITSNLRKILDEGGEFIDCVAIPSERRGP